MKENIKKIAVIATVLFASCGVLPADNYNIFNEKAYASSSSDYELSELELKSSGGSKIKLYDSSSCDSDDKIDSSDVKAGRTYYTKKISYENVKIDISGVDDDKVRVFLGKKDSTKGIKVGKTINLSSGTNVLTIRVYNSDPGSSIKYKDDDDVEKTYTIRVKYDGSDDDDDDDDYDDIYLKSITLSEGNIDFYKKTTSYDVYVNSSVNKLTIKAKPDDDDDDEYTVTIDGTEVDDSDNYKREVSLSNGKNTIQIKVEDEDNDDYRKYTLYVYRGNYNNTDSVGSGSSGYNPITSSTVINTGNGTGNIHTSAVTTPTNQWSVVNGHWAFIDSLGRQLANTWYYDSGLGNYYYFKADGAMATGWQYVNGKWYYLYASGAMAKNTSINGYYLDSDGAWIA
ncbi:MAG: cadherin-like beta sandwich domain-containing protein [Clostridium sp.]|nr:cadherin-like beta sandwich domain-containing protein [Clostridium sp.]